MSSVSGPTLFTFLTRKGASCIELDSKLKEVEVKQGEDSVYEIYSNSENSFSSTGWYKQVVLLRKIENHEN